MIKVEVKITRRDVTKSFPLAEGCPVARATRRALRESGEWRRRDEISVCNEGIEVRLSGRKMFATLPADVVDFIEDYDRGEIVGGAGELPDAFRVRFTKPRAKKFWWLDQ